MTSKLLCLFFVYCVVDVFHPLSNVVLTVSKKGFDTFTDDIEHGNNYVSINMTSQVSVPGSSASINKLPEEASHSHYCRY